MNILRKSNKRYKEKKKKYRVTYYRNRTPFTVLFESDDYYEAVREYYKLIKENKVLFPKRWRWEGHKLITEIALVGPRLKPLTKYKEDKSGIVYDVIQVPKGKRVIHKVHKYAIEETFKYYNGKKMVNCEFVLKLLASINGTKMITPFNNKLIIEIFESEYFHLFILKNEYDAKRLFNTIKRFNITNKIKDCFFFKISTKYHLESKPFRDRVQEKTGIAFRELLKRSTRP